MKKKNLNQKTNKDILIKWGKSPRTFIRDVWGLVPQVKGERFQKGVHITWQQDSIIQSLEDAVNGKAPCNISIRTGHGIGKSNIMSKIIIWFLFCFYKSKIGLTAPDSQTLYDALFSEVGKALSDIERDEIKNCFDKTSDYLRVVGSEDDWFARCKTGKKENPEALAGLHADSIMLIGEEASGIPEEIFTSGQSNLTGDLNIFILIGNPLRNVGFFYETFGDSDWQNLHFNGEESPITGDYPKRIEKKYGRDSDEFRRRVLGEFPREDILDTKGYVQLLSKDDIKKVVDLSVYGERKILGVDCAGSGKDLTTWVLRDGISAIIVGSEKISDENSIAQKTLTIMKQFGVDANDIIIDNFGAGANVGMALAKLGYTPRPIYVGERKQSGGKIIEEGQKMLNIRSLLYWRLKSWIEGGGKLNEHEGWKELLYIRYKRTLQDEIQIMSKEDMRKEGYKSPDYADALSLTFYEMDLTPESKEPLIIDFSSQI